MRQYLTDTFMKIYSEPKYQAQLENKQEFIFITIHEQDEQGSQLL